MVKNFCPRKNKIGHYREFFSKKALHLKYFEKPILRINFETNYWMATHLGQSGCLPIELDGLFDRFSFDFDHGHSF